MPPYRLPFPSLHPTAKLFSRTRSTEEAQHSGAHLKVLTLTGNTDSAISIAAQAENADLIAIGTHGRGGLERMRLPRTGAYNPLAAVGQLAPQIDCKQAEQHRNNADVSGQ